VKKTIKRFAALSSAAACFALGSPASAQYSGDTVRIGFITDLASLYSDIDGQGGVEAIRMAIADFGGAVNGKKIELLVADHQNKADIAASKAREWIDQQGVDVLIGGTGSGATLAMSRVAAERRKPIIVIASGSSRFTNEECTPYTVHYSYDTIALAKVAGSEIVKQGGDSWYFLTADYAFGASLEGDASSVVKANGGKVLGASKHPLNTSDFAAYLIQAQTSKAKILALANAGGDTINAIKAANEFGINKSMNLVGLLMFIPDVHSLGLRTTKGMYLADAWYWDRTPETRAWAKRYFEKMKKAPSSNQAGDYSAALTYLKAAKAAGTDDGEKIMARLKGDKINDMFATNGYIREDGRMVHDMFLMQVKSPEASKYPWDYYNLIKTVPGEQAFATKTESKCALWR
jgi:branched-chain amino acid transport system substrate-binding protein